MRKNKLLLAATVLAATTALTACSSGSGTPSASDDVKVVGGEVTGTGADALTVTDPWVKTADAKAGMTAVFGVLENTGTTDITVQSAKTSASGMTQLHEMVMKDNEMIMQEKEGGFVIKAGAKHELAPGGDHLMVMDMAKAIEAGDEVTVRLTLDDGSTEDFTALAKTTSAGEEKYEDSDMTTEGTE